MRPVVGITGPDRGGLVAWLFTSAAVRLSGGRPVRITPSRAAPDIDLQALILGGGADIDPKRHQATLPPPPPKAPRRHGRRARVLATLGRLRRLFGSMPGVVDTARDALETELLDRAIANRIPVLGICRGAQLMNVHLGGSLHLGLQSFYVDRPNPRTVLPQKQVELAPESLLARILGSGSVGVNSLHGQAVARLGRELAVVATEKNGVVQAIERPGHPYFVGVQWHPEYMPQHRAQRRLFRVLVGVARDGA
jgi:putative glutamine amidotransferase